MGRLREAAKPMQRASASRVRDVLDQLDKGDSEDLQEMLADEQNFTASAIERVLRRECGVTLSHTTISRYRETLGG